MFVVVVYVENGRNNVQLHCFHFNCSIDKDTDECRQPRRSRKRDLLKRVMSSSHHRSNTIEISDSERNSPTRDAKSIVSEFPSCSLSFSHSLFVSLDIYHAL